MPYLAAQQDNVHEVACRQEDEPGIKGGGKFFAETYITAKKSKR